MSKTALAAGLTPQDALQTIARATSFESSLRARTSGITWMVWAFVTAGMFVTYSYAGLRYGEDFPLWATQLWIPWVLLGAIATRVIWKSAALAVPVLAKEARGKQGLKYGLLFFTIFFVGFFVTEELLKTTVVEPAIMMGLFGITVLTMGTTGFFCPSRLERGLALAGGLLLVVLTAVALVALRGTNEAVAYEVFGVLGPITSGLVYFLIGLILVVRG